MPARFVLSVSVRDTADQFRYDVVSEKHAVLRQGYRVAVPCQIARVGIARELFRKEAGEVDSQPFRRRSSPRQSAPAYTGIPARGGLHG